MNFLVTVKKELNERGKKMLNAKLECHLTRPHALSHEVFTYIDIDIDIDIDWLIDINR